MFEKSELSTFTGKKINVLAILEKFFSSREIAYCENLIFGALEPHFQARKITFFENFY